MVEILQDVARYVSVGLLAASHKTPANYKKRDAVKEWSQFPISTDISNSDHLD